jgi:type I restriction enzyme S subunit
MSFPKYEKYKDSGVNWMGAVPAHWAVTALKRVAALRSGDPITSEAIAEEGAYPVFGGNGERGYTDRFTHDGDFALIGRQGALCGNVNYATGKFWASEHAVVVSPRKPVTTRWIGELLRAMNLNQYSVSAAQPGLSVEIVSNLAIPLPPEAEQAAIGAYLDCETAKIDALVEEQKRLIELLKEKRQAVISKAVSKGLAPSVPMKDSGVEWLGKVPAHWDVVPVKFFARVGNGSTPNRDRADYWEDGNFPWLSSTVVNQGIVTEPTQLVTQIALAECHLPIVKPPAVVIGITGEGKTRGMAAQLGIEATINQHLAFVKTQDESLSATLLRRYFEMAYVQMRFESDGGGSTKGAITCDQIANMRVPIPPMQERQFIINFLDCAIEQIDALSAEAQSGVDLLQERRSALISAAVTGKIDVRRAAGVESSA